MGEIVIPTSNFHHLRVIFLIHKINIKIILNILFVYPFLNCMVLFVLASFLGWY